MKTKIERTVIAVLQRASILEVLEEQLSRYRVAHGRNPELALLNRSLRAPLAVEILKNAPELPRDTLLADPFSFDGVQFFFNISKNSPTWIKLIDKERDIELSL